MANETTQELVETLTAEGERTYALFMNLSPELWSVPIYTEPLVWTPRHILIHLVDAEAGLKQILEAALNHQAGLGEDYDLHGHNKDAVTSLYERWAADDTEKLVGRLRKWRDQLIAIVGQFPEERLGETLRHPLLGIIPVREFVRVVYLHHKMHGRDIKLGLEKSARAF